MSLTLTGGPASVAEVPDPDLDSGETLTQAILQAINGDVCFAAVVVEDFWGFYRHGETVVLPVSAADGYNYSRGELLYAWEIFAAGAAPGALNGTQTPPTPGANSGAGQILQMGFNIDQGSGVVSCAVSYYVSGGAQTNTTDGILRIHTLARRLSTNPTVGSVVVYPAGTQILVGYPGLP